MCWDRLIEWEQQPEQQMDRKLALQESIERAEIQALASEPLELVEAAA